MVRFHGRGVASSSGAPSNQISESRGAAGVGGNEELGSCSILCRGATTRSISSSAGGISFSIDASSTAMSAICISSSWSIACRLLRPPLLVDVVAIEDGTGITSTDSSAGLFFGGRPLLVERGVAWTLISDSASSVSFVCDDFCRLGVRFIGVPALLFTPAPGIGVPFDFRGLPLLRGVVGSSSSLKGTVVVVALCRTRTLACDPGDWNNLRRVATDEGSASSVSTVTSSFCGAELSPTSSSNVCLRGDTLLVALRDANRFDTRLRVTRRVELGKKALSSAVSLRGSGEDMMSALGVYVLVIGCHLTA